MACIDFSIANKKILDIQSSYEDTSQRFHLYYDSKKFKTDSYDPTVCAVRRGSSICFDFELKSKKFRKADLSIQLSTMNRASPFDIHLIPNDFPRYGFVFEILSATDKTLGASLEVGFDAPIGLYQIYVCTKKKTISIPLTFYVIYNPFSEDDTVCVPEKKFRRRYLFNPKAYAFYGADGKHFRRSYKLDQILSNDDYGLLVGNWKGNPTSPSEFSTFRGVGEICRQCLLTGKPVLCDKPEIASICFESLCKCLGIPTITINMFPSFHEIGPKGQVVREFYGDNLQEFHSTHSTLLNHCSNLCCIKVNILDLNQNRFSAFWQYVDVVPQDRQGGFYRIGPCAIDLIKQDQMPEKQDRVYDEKHIYHTFHPTVTYMIMSRDMLQKQPMSFRDRCKSIIHGDRHGEELFLTNIFYSPQVIQPDVLKVKFDVPKSIQITDQLKYSVSIENASSSSESTLLFLATLVNGRGFSLESPKVLHSLKFQSSQYTLSGTMEPFQMTNMYDLSTAQIEFEIRILNLQDQSKSLVSKDYTVVESLFTGEIKADIVEPDSNQIYVTVMSNLKRAISNCVVSIKKCYGEEMSSVHSRIEDNQQKTDFVLDTNKLSYGLNRLELWIKCALGSYLLCRKTVMKVPIN